MQFSQLSFSREVKDALDNKKPIVALESTIITHGMPYPENKDTAILLEDTIRSEGACPATIAILDGSIRIGLNTEELDMLARQGSNKTLKVSTKDIPYALVNQRNGGTTVAATMYLAHLSGIHIFATGGIGGVHRGAEINFDISADLEELAKTPVAVICAGAKSILDLGLTLEYLETKAVPVIGYQTDVLPAFYTSKSDFLLDIAFNTIPEIAQFLSMKWNLATHATRNTGVVIANPIPNKYSMEESYIQQIIDEAIQQCKQEDIRGKAITPFLLAYIEEKTEKKSLFSNIQLIKNNAHVAAQIAVEYIKLH